MVTKNDFDWPGWPLDNNPYSKEFDLEARQRMVEGSEQLLPLLRRYDLGLRVLEVGPFFNPLVTPEQFPHVNITFIDNDLFVIEYLRGKFPHATILFQDVNSPSTVPKQSYSAIVASHTLNYLDYRAFMRNIPACLQQDGLLFINNVLQYGLPPFFSPQRPQHQEDIPNAVTEAGLTILEHHLLPSPNKKLQPHERLLLVAQKK